MVAYIRSKGFRVRKAELRVVIHEMDPSGPAYRWPTKLKRRRYEGNNKNQIIINMCTIASFVVFLHVFFFGGYFN
jgi:hypothetical protein